MSAKKLFPSSDAFKKDDDIPPFFSIHPKTKLGTYIRIALYAFMFIVLVLGMTARTTGYMYARYWSLYYLVYIIPAILICALIILAVFKRMKRNITRIAVPSILALVVVLLGMSFSSLLSFTCSLSLYPEIKVVHGDNAFLLMRTCDYPDDTTYTTINEGTEAEAEVPSIPYRYDAYRYTAACENGEECRVEGEIMLPASADYKVSEEWLNEESVRFFIESDSSGSGYGEIIVTFGQPADTETNDFTHGAIASVRNRLTNASGTHTVSLFREDSFMWGTADSIYNLNFDALKRYYIALPATKLNFVNTNVKVDGEIVLEPYAKLTAVDVREETEGIIVITPSETIEGASGSVTVYLNGSSDTSTAEAE